MKLTTWLAGWTLALLFSLLKATCRPRVADDPRPEFRANGTRYIYAVLHAHQLSTLVIGDTNLAAMVSRSADGELIVPMLRMYDVKPIRGSSRRKGRDKGGTKALEQMIEHVASGKPAYIAVDGPNGPRNRIRKGIAQLAINSDALVLPSIAIPSRRWIWRKSWDRLQVPKPFCSIKGVIAEPLSHQEGESVEQFRRRIEQALNALEAAHDPEEAAFNDSLAEFT